MAHWDEDSPKLRRNLGKVLREVRDGAIRREIPTLASARRWQQRTMAGLDIPNPETAGRFRGENGIADARVWIGATEGVSPEKVANELKGFERRIRRTLAALDELLPPGVIPDFDGLSAVIDLAAWAHAEWIRIHPFVNGNGRTARMWANAIFMRYGLNPVVRLRPRPDGGYETAAARAMHGDWRSTASVFRRMLLGS